MQSFLLDRIPSPIGDILIAVADDRLCALDFADCERRMHQLLRRRFGAFELIPADDPAGIPERIRAYLAGDIHAVDGIAVMMNGSPFQERAWNALRTIPAGATASYGEQAARLGEPKAARAVGHANSLNPIAIVVPCHRVIGMNGALTGFAGGIERKRWLLAHERREQYSLELE